jgi:hypothetical protein
MRASTSLQPTLVLHGRGCALNARNAVLFPQVGRAQVVAFQAEATAAQPVGESNAWGMSAAAHGNGFRHRLIPMRVVPSQQGAGVRLPVYAYRCTVCVRARQPPADEGACKSLRSIRSLFASMATPPGAAAGAAAYAAERGGEGLFRGARRCRCGCGGRRLQLRSGWHRGIRHLSVPRLRAAEPQARAAAARSALSSRAAPAWRGRLLRISHVPHVCFPQNQQPCAVAVHAVRPPGAEQAAGTKQHASAVDAHALDCRRASNKC